MALGKKKQQLDPVALAQAQQAREQMEVQAAFQKGITAYRIPEKQLYGSLGCRMDISINEYIFNVASMQLNLQNA